MRWYQAYKKVLLFSTVNALILALLTLVWMNLSWEFGDEVIVSRINQIVRYEIFNPKNAVVEKFKKDLLLINTSYDNALIDYEDDLGAGNKTVTDRKKLASFFRLVTNAGVQPALVVVDIVFEDPSADDSVLRAELAKVKNLVISTELDPQGKPIAPWPGLNFALAQYSTTTGTFLKYNLVNDTVHYLPAAMLHETSGARFREWSGLVRTDPGWWMNSFIVDLPVRKVHMDDGTVLVWNLGDALTYEINDVRELIANRIIIVGDFYRYDVHQTLLGQQPGPLIVANAYLGMLQGVPRIKLLDGFLIFVLYFFSTMYVLAWRSHRTKLSEVSVGRMKPGKYFLKYLTYLVVFSLYSILLYLLTSRHFQLLLFGLYFNLLEYLLDKYPENWLTLKTESPALETANVD